MHKLHIVFYAIIAYNILEVTIMYKKMYLLLFNTISKALEENDIEQIKLLLKNAQRDAEEICIESDEEI